MKLKNYLNESKYLEKESTYHFDNKVREIFRDTIKSPNLMLGYTHKETETKFDSFFEIFLTSTPNKISNYEYENNPLSICLKISIPIRKEYDMFDENGKGYGYSENHINGKLKFSLISNEIDLDPLKSDGKLAYHIYKKDVTGDCDKILETIENFFKELRTILLDLQKSNKLNDKHQVMFDLFAKYERK